MQQHALERGARAERASSSRGTTRSRILVVSELYWPTEGGAAMMMRQLADAWRAQGHRVTVLTRRSEPGLAERETVDGVEIVRLVPLNIRFAYSPQFVARVISWLRRRRGEFDAVCVSMLKHAAFAAVTACRPLGIPVVLRTEGGGQTGDVAWQERALFGRWIRRRCREAQATVAISEPIHEELLAAGYPEERVRRIPNGVPIPLEPWRREATAGYRKQLGLPEAPTVCYTGRLRAEKGLADLVRALPLIRSAGGVSSSVAAPSSSSPAAAPQLLFVGDGVERPNLERLAAETGVADRVHFAGHVADVLPYLRASELYALPSYIEGMSVALLEALALGLPAIAGDIDANRDLVPERLLPLFPVRAPDALARAIEGQIGPRADRPGGADEARAFVSERFGLDSVARRYVELFETLRREMRRPAGAGAEAEATPDRARTARRD